MNYEKSDKIIAEKYMSFEPDFDAENAWDQLEPKIKRKKRRGFWLWYIAGISLLGLFAYYQFTSEDGISDGDSLEYANDRNTELLAEATHNSINDKEEIRNDREAELSVDDQLLTSQNTRVEDNRQSIDNDNNIEEQFSNALKHSEEYNIDESTKNTVVKSESSTKFEIDLKQIADITEVNNKTNISCELLPATINELVYDRQLNILLISSPKPPIASHSSKGTMRLGVFGGYFIHSRSLNHSGDGSDENYISRVAEEEAADAFDLGLKLDYFINDNFIVFGGVRYDQSYVQRNADYVYLESITLPDQTILIIETENGPVEQKGDITYDGYYAHKANNYLTTKRLGILAGIQYRIGEDKWKSSFNLGVEMPILTTLSGTITNDGKPYNLPNGDLEIIKNSPLIFGGIGGEYTLSEGIGLQLMISGYLPAGNEYKESYNIIKKSTQLGVNLGVYFQL